MGFAIAKNKIKTVLIVAIIAALLYLVVYFLADFLGFGSYAVAIAGGVSILTSLFSYWNSGKLALSMNGAKKATGSDEALIRGHLAPICRKANLPMPQIYVIEDMSPNAFATGRNPKHAAVAVTRGLLSTVNAEELSGVLAHEMAHVKNYDILLQTIAAIMIGFVIIIADVFGRSMMFGGARRRRDRDGGNAVMVLIGMILMIFAPIAGQLLKMALSRNREYLADAQAAEFTGRPEALASALLKLQAHAEPVMRANNATAPMYISDPVKKATGSSFANLFSTHPPIEKRVEALRAMR